jgi:hypothetical protein
MANIAPNTTCSLAGTRIWMCRLNFDPPKRECKTEDSQKSSQNSSETSIFDDYMDGLHVTPLNSAYVLLIPLTGGGESIPLDPANVRLCRTGKDGELLKISEGEIDSGVPPSNESTWQVFCPEDEMLYCWTLSVDRFKRVLREAREDLEEARRTYDFAAFRVVRERIENDSDGEFLFELFDGPHLTVWLLRHALAAPSSGPLPGYVKGYDLRNPPTKWNASIHHHCNFVFARRRVADAIYCGELIQNHAISLRQRSVKEFAIFAQLQDFCRKSEEHERVERLDKAAEHQIFRDVYFEYAYACARELAIKRDLFQKAATVSFNQNGWKAAAVQIATISNGSCVHPCIDLSQDDPRWKFRRMDPHMVMEYFDFYRFGADPHMIETANHSADAEYNVSIILDNLRGKVSSLLGGLHYYDVLVCVGDYPEADTVDRRIHERYLELSVDVQHPWWETFDPEEESLWEKLKPILEDGGYFVDKATYLYNDHLGNVETIEKYNAMLKSSKKRATRMFKKLADWNKLLGGETLTLKRGSFQVTADGATGIVTVKDGSRKVAEMRLLVTDVREVKTKVPLPKLKSRAQKMRFRQVTNFHASYFLELETPFKEITAWPRWLNVIGLAVATSISILEAREKLAEKVGGTETMLAVTRVAKDTFELIESFSSALHASLPYAEEEGAVVKFAKLGEKFAGPGFVLEAFLNVHDGMLILLFDEDTLAAEAKDRGDDFEVWLQESKGFVLVMSPAPGVAAAGYGVVAELGTAATFEAAIAALGMSLAIAGVVIVAIDVATYVHEGFSSSMLNFEKKVREARKKEFGDASEKDRTQASLHHFLKTADHLAKRPAQESVWQTSTQ